MTANFVAEGIAQAPHRGLKAALNEDAVILDTGAKILGAIIKACGYFDENGPLPKLLNLGTEEWLDSIDQSRKTIQSREIEPLSAMPPAFALDGAAAAIQGQVLRAEARLETGVSHLEMKNVDAKLLDDRATYIRMVENVIMKFADNSLPLQPFMTATDIINLTAIVPYDALPKLEQDIQDKRADILAARNSDAVALLGHISRTMQALDVEEIKAKEALEANREKLKLAQNLMKQIEAAAQAIEAAKRDEVESAEQLEAAKSHYVNANTLQQEAQTRRNNAQVRFSNLQSTINKGPWICPNGNSWETCNHTAKSSWQNDYEKARKSIKSANSELNEAKIDLDATNKELTNAAQNKKACEDAFRAAVAHTNALVASRDKLRADSQPTLDEVFNLLFSFGGDDLLTDIANVRARLSALQQRVQRAAQ